MLCDPHLSGSRTLLFLPADAYVTLNNSSLAAFAISVFICSLFCACDCCKRNVCCRCRFGIEKAALFLDI